MTKAKNKTYYLFAALLAAAFVYGLVLPFCWGNDPADPLGTLSHLCENRKLYFWIWTFLDGGAYAANTYLLYKKYGGAGKYIKTLPVIAFISAVVIAATLGHPITDWNPKRVAHWVATGAYIGFIALSLAAYALKNIKKDAIFVKLLIAVLCELAIFLLWFVIFGKSGYLEVICHALVQILLFIFNFVIDKQKKEC